MVQWPMKRRLRFTRQRCFSPDTKELQKLPVKSGPFRLDTARVPSRMRNSYPWAPSKYLECTYSGSDTLADSIVLEPLRSLPLLLSLQHIGDETASSR